MDRSLWLLLQLRIYAFLRRWGRGLKTPKGLLLAIMGACVFLPMTLPFFVVPRVMVGTQIEAIRRFGPLALFVYSLLNILLSSGDRAIYYSPAEVDFLFCGPYRPRQILIYKIVCGISAALLTALIMTFAVAHHTSSFLAAFLGLFFTFEMMYLLTLAVGLTLSTLGALAASRSRWLVLVAIIVLAAVSFGSVGREAFILPNWDVVKRAIDSPAMSVALAPFRPFVMTFTAERIWPDLLGWSALAGLIELTLLALVIALNAQFLEAAAAASTRVHARLQRMRRGDLSSVNPRRLFAVPMFPWWGGIGPNFWRQLTTASRSPAQLVSLLLMLSMPLFMLLLIQSGGGVAPEMKRQGEAVEIYAVLPAFICMVLFAQSIVAFDFRLDRPRMETLKTLPIRPTYLAFGQLLASVVILSAAECLTLAMLACLDTRAVPQVAAMAVLIVPVNLLTVAVENLFFLWYPHRITGVNSFDLQAIGRQLLLMTAKLATIGVTGSVAAGVGALVYWFGGESWTATIVSAATILGVCGLGLVPVVAHAFERFDVAGDVLD